MGHGIALIFGAWVGIFTSHMVSNRIDQGLPIFSSESAAIAGSQTNLTIGGLFQTDHTELVPAGGTGAPVEEQPYQPSITYGPPPTDHWELPDAVRTKEERLSP